MVTHQLQVKRRTGKAHPRRTEDISTPFGLCWSMRQLGILYHLLQYVCKMSPLHICGSHCNQYIVIIQYDTWTYDAHSQLPAPNPRCHVIRPHRSTAYVDAVYCYRLSSVVGQSVCKNADPIKMPFGLWTQVGARKRVLQRVHIGSTWQIRLNRPSVAAMRSFLSNYFYHLLR